MTTISNSHIILILIIIIVVVFLSNYDVYVVAKNTPLVDTTNLITKNEMKQENFESQLKEVILSMNDKQRKVIEKTLEIIDKMDTDLSTEDVNKILLFVNNAYQSSPDYQTFYDNIVNDPKINEYPYNTKYTLMVVNLISKFDNDVNKSKNKPKNKTKKVSFGEKQIIPYVPPQEKQIMASNQDNFSMTGQFNNYSRF